jgi:hypothetical protein
MEGSFVLCTDFHAKVFHGLLNLPWYRAACEEGFLDFCECLAETHPKSNRGLKMLFSGRRLSCTVASFFFRKLDHRSEICLGPCGGGGQLCI